MQSPHEDDTSVLCRVEGLYASLTLIDTSYFQGLDDLSVNVWSSLATVYMKYGIDSVLG